MFECKVKRGFSRAHKYKLYSYLWDFIKFARCIRCGQFVSYKTGRKYIAKEYKVESLKKALDFSCAPGVSLELCEKINNQLKKELKEAIRAKIN